MKNQKFTQLFSICIVVRPPSLKSFEKKTLADQFTLSRPGWAHYPHPLLLAPTDFQTLRQPWYALVLLKKICQNCTHPEKQHYKMLLLKVIWLRSTNSTPLAPKKDSKWKHNISGLSLSAQKIRTEGTISKHFYVYCL